jgi:hypothetical protein
MAWKYRLFGFDPSGPEDGRAIGVWPPPPSPPDAPDGLYVVRSGAATAVTAEALRDAEKRASCFFFPPPLEAFQRLLAALTQAQGGAE